MSRRSTSISKGERRKESEPRFEPLVVTVRAAMDLLGDSRSTVYRKIKQGRLKSHRDGGRRKIDFQSIKRDADQPLHLAPLRR